MKYDPIKDATLKKLISPAIHAAIEQAFGKPFHTKLHSVSITHTELQPEGDTLTINLVVELHEKVEVKK